MILYKLCALSVLNLPCVCICKVIVCIYVIVSIKFYRDECSILHKEPHRQTGMDRVMTSGSLGGVMVSKQIQNAKDVCSMTSLDTMFPIFITPSTLDAVIMILLCAVWVLNLPYVCLCKITVCVYVIVTIKRLTISGRQL